MDVTNIITLAGIAILSCVLCVIVRQFKPEAALGIGVACGVVILVSAVMTLAPSIDALSRISDAAGIDNGFAKILIKALAICYITQLSADCCRDAGESAIAAKLELAGRAAVVALSLPVFTQLAELVTGLMG